MKQLWLGICEKSEVRSKLHFWNTNSKLLNLVYWYLCLYLTITFRNISGYTLSILIFKKVPAQITWTRYPTNLKLHRAQIKAWLCIQMETDGFSNYHKRTLLISVNEWETHWSLLNSQVNKNKEKQGLYITKYTFHVFSQM